MHLRQVAELARRFAEPFGAGDWAYWAGLWHDLGKAHPDWQAYVRGQSDRPPEHALAGAYWASKALPPLAPVIAGHHAGLPALVELKASLKDPAAINRWEQALDAIGRHLDGIAVLPERSSVAPPASPEALEMLLRFIFSAVVDADFLDTEAHFRRKRSQGPEGEAILSLLWGRLQADQARLSGKGPMAGARQAVYEHCLRGADGPVGWFRLAAPTGTGKTRSAMAFALRHALRHGLRRVIVAVPYTTVTEQIASVYRSLFGARHVLEHHSAAPPVDDPEVAEWAELTSENWDAPIVVTTTVQLFESLFSNRPGPCRKLHRIARSVLVLDEAQALPPTLMAPILGALHELSGRYHCSVLFSTATPPAWRQAPFAQWLEGAVELLPDAERWADAVRRVTYTWRHLDGPVSWPKLADELRRLPRALVVVNTTADAARLWRLMDDPEALHLSRRLYADHRRRVLNVIRERLASSDPCRVVATQVVEAGVDLDFPVVFRALGPLDRIVQSAGRCNREGSQRQGHVVVFEPDDARLPPGSYKTATDVTRVLIRTPDAVPDRPDFVGEFFARFYASVATDAPGIQALRSRLDYPAVARAFRMIEEGPHRPVVVRDPTYEPACRAVDGLLQWLRRADGMPGRNWWRALQPYVVEIPGHEFEAAAAKGWVERVRGEVWVWTGPYHPVLGLAGLELV